MTTRADELLAAGIDDGPKLAEAMKNAKRSYDMVEVANAWQIDSKEAAQAVNDDLKQIVVTRKALEQQQKDMLEPLKESEKRIRDFFAPPLAKLKEAESILKGKVSTFLESERRALIAAQEAARRAEEERQAALAAAEAAASAELEAGNTEAAMEMVAGVMENLPAVAAAPQATKLDGTSTRLQWYAEVTDLMALVKAVADGRQPLAMLEPNMVMLNGMAKAQKEVFAVPGVEAKTKAIVSVRG